MNCCKNCKHFNEKAGVFIGDENRVCAACFILDQFLMTEKEEDKNYCIYNEKFCCNQFEEKEGLKNGKR